MHPLFAHVKDLEDRLQLLIEAFEKANDSPDPRAVAIAKTHFETACMWLTRSLFEKGEKR